MLEASTATAAAPFDRGSTSGSAAAAPAPAAGSDAGRSTGRRAGATPGASAPPARRRRPARHRKVRPARRLCLVSIVGAAGILSGAVAATVRPAAAAARTTAEEAPPPPTAAAPTEDPGPYRYNICNGLSNQLLYHAANVALAIQQGRDVEVPNYFIVDGVQHSDANVLPNRFNSVPFGVAFDAEAFLARVTALGGGRIQARLVDFNLTSDDGDDADQIPCTGMAPVRHAPPDTMLAILQSFRPSEEMARIIHRVQGAIGRPLDRGVCLHHRDGPDWHAHCRRWSRIPDGIYRGNCLLPEGVTLPAALRLRGLTDPAAQWIYYAGDHEVPAELRDNAGGAPVVTRDQLMRPEEVAAIERYKPPAVQLHPRHMPRRSFLTVLLQCVTGRGCLRERPPEPSTRDLGALLDFFICRGLHGFVGNSVSTFSALQIAMREGENAYWYNSQSIPLAGLLQAFAIPLVYTYSEHSEYYDKFMLQASITSARTHMPRNKIHVLYHGERDTSLRKWLEQQDVVIHAQALPKSARSKETKARTQLLQRLEIPNLLNTEYVLLLDPDTVILHPFTLATFGQNLTRSLAMSSGQIAFNKPENDGVVLMNLPYLRETLGAFSKFVSNYTQRPVLRSIMDHGAYLEFYNVTFLPRTFNFKPFWDKNNILGDTAYVAQFYKAKPHGYIKHSIGDPCMVRRLCDKALLLPTLCQIMMTFANASKAATPGPSAYCHQAFPNQTMALVCDEVLEELASLTGNCTDLPSIVRRVLVRKGTVYADLQGKLLELNRQVNRLQQEREAFSKMQQQQQRLALEHAPGPMRKSYFFSLFLPWAVIAISLLVQYEKKRRMQRKHKLSWRGFSSPPSSGGRRIGASPIRY